MKNKTKFLLTIIFVLGILILLGSTNVYAGISIPGGTEGAISTPVTDLGRFNLSINYGITKSQGIKIELQNPGCTVNNVRLGGYNSGLFTLESYDASAEPITFKIKPNAIIPTGIYYLELKWSEQESGVDNNGMTWIKQKNYKASIDVTINKALVTITSNIEDNQMFYYDGQTKSPIGSVTVQNNQTAQNTLTATYIGVGTTNYNSTTPPTEIGIYTVTYSVSENYEATPLSYAFVISKGTPTYNIPTDLQGKKGQKLSNITLPTGFTWEEPDTELVLGKQTYTATYTPTDTKNYKIINNINIEVDTKEFVSLTTRVNGMGGTITSSMPEIEKGSTKTISFTPFTGYTIDKVLVNNVNTPVTNNQLKLTLNENTTVEVTYKKIQFIITIVDNEGVISTPNGTVNVEYGDNKDIEITEKNDYKLIKVLVDNIETTLDGNTLKLTNIKKNIKVESVVEKLYNIITKVNGTGGTISNSVTGLKKDSIKTIEFTPNEGYMIDKVLVNGVETQVTNNQLELTLNENTTVEVTYKKIPFIITIADNEGVITTPNGIVNVEYGDNKDIEITAKSDYKLLKVFVDGVEIALEGDTLKLTNITKDIKIETVAEKVLYNIKTNVNGTGGKISSSTTRIKKDTIKTIKFTPDEGYMIDKVLVNGVETTVTNNELILTANVDRTIEVTYKKTPVETKNNEEEKTTQDNTGNEEIKQENVGTEELIKESKTKETLNPKTTDNITIYIAMAIISLVVLGTVTIIRKNNG